MPTDIDAILAYGYDLGGPGRWNTHNLDYNFPWWDDDVDSFTRAVYQELQSYRRTNIDANVDGVEAVWYGSDTRHGIGIGYILCTTHYSTYYSHAFPIEPNGPIAGREQPTWDRRLQQAARVLGLLPSLPPRWILAASHGS